jgi:hypothetical protein
MTTGERDCTECHGGGNVASWNADGEREFDTCRKCKGDGREPCVVCGRPATVFAEDDEPACAACAGTAMNEEAA